LTQWIEKCMDGNKPSSCPLCKAVFVVSKDWYFVCLLFLFIDWIQQFIPT
jgi:hypothetical protein